MGEADFSSALAVLSAMITPAVLISACGALVLSTSNRLGRVIDRVRDLSDRFESLIYCDESGFQSEKRTMILHQLELSTRRARLLQHSLTSHYLAIGIFVFTTIAVGVIGAAGAPRYSWLAVLLGLIGSCFLCYGSAVLILEARFAFESTRMETDFVWKMSRRKQNGR
jgi:hypothetical protein